MSDSGTEDNWLEWNAEMIGAVFLCDKEWTVKNIRFCVPELTLNVGQKFDTWTEDAKLLSSEKEQYSAEIVLPADGFCGSVFVHSFQQGNLVILAKIGNDREFVEFQNVYPEHIEWAKDHLVGLYHDEYFLIQ